MRARRGAGRLVALAAVAAIVAGCIDDRPVEEPVETRLIKILAIDGGGARGIIPAMVLAEIEARTGRPIHELFDVVAGTSTGSLIAAMLTVPQPETAAVRSAEGIVSFYEGEGATLFFARSEEYAERAASFTVPAYPASSHIAGIQAAISPTALLSEAATNLVVTIYNLSEDPPRTYEMTRWKARHGRDGTPASDHDFLVWEGIRAASTFPGIWPGATLESVGGTEYYPLDGGMFAINPVLEGLAHSIRLLNNKGEDGDIYRFLVVSLGTGYFNQTDLVGEKTQDWGPLQWYREGAVPHIVEVLFEGQTDSASGLMEEIQSDDGRVQHYHRFQPMMEHDFKLDDVDPASIATLRGYAETMIEERSEEIDAICALLAEGKGIPEPDE